MRDFLLKLGYKRLNNLDDVLFKKYLLKSQKSSDFFNLDTKSYTYVLIIIDMRTTPYEVTAFSVDEQTYIPMNKIQVKELENLKKYVDMVFV